MVELQEDLPIIPQLKVQIKSLHSYSWHYNWVLIDFSLRRQLSKHTNIKQLAEEFRIFFQYKTEEFV